jgi:CRP-like cAMP-binding protein
MDRGRIVANHNAKNRRNAMPEDCMPQQNHLLGALSGDVKQRLFPHLEYVELSRGQVLHASGDTLGQLYFPADSIVSLLNVMEHGASAELSIVGNEGVVGISLIMAGEHPLHHAVVQNGGHAWRLSGQYLKEELDRGSDLLLLLLSYTQALITQMAQTAVCNRHHSIDQQLCRWLLLCLDRLPGSQSTMATALIANMLGMRREGVTEATGKLQRQGVIECSHEHITVLDRKRLEQLSCECYAVVKKETDRLMSSLPMRY